MLPDESLDGSRRRSTLDTFDFLEAMEGVGEEGRDHEPDSLMTIVDEGEESPVGVAAGEARRREAYRDLESAALMAFLRGTGRIAHGRRRREPFFSNSSDLPPFLATSAGGGSP